MILQNFILPKIGVCSEQELYCHLQNASIDFEKSTVVLPHGSKVIFDTYFNSFLCDRWKKYTTIETLALELMGQGCGALRIYRKSHVNGTELIFQTTIEFQSEGSQRVSLFENAAEIYGILYIEYEATFDSVFLGAAFVTDQVLEREVSLGLVITTFKREQYVKNNLASFEKNLFDIMSSQELHVYIVDNGQSLDISNTERVTIIPNANYGGAGGFARGMLEIEENGRHSHIVFCDDDAVYEPESFIRLQAFLGLAKTTDLCVGGKMFRIDQPYITHESGAFYYEGTLFPNKHQLDMTSIESVVIFGIEENPFYHGWWFFAFPAAFTKTVGYPLPFFFRGDDMEFSWRLRELGIITTDLNGICVWHESFERKSATMTDYYIARNEAIMRLIHENDLTTGKLAMKIIRHVMSALLTYRYDRAEMVMRGYEDFLKGPEFLKSISPPKLHKDLLTLQKEKTVPISKELLAMTKYNRPVRNYAFKRLVMALTFNGMLLPTFFIDRNKGIMSEGYVIEPLHSTRLAAIFKKESVLYIDIDSLMGYLTKRSVQQFWKGVLELGKLLLKFILNFKTLQALYRNEFPTMIKRSFWQKYLARKS